LGSTEMMQGSSSVGVRLKQRQRRTRHVFRIFSNRSCVRHSHCPRAPNIVRPHCIGTRGSALPFWKFYTNGGLINHVLLSSENFSGLRSKGITESHPSVLTGHHPQDGNQAATRLLEVEIQRLSPTRRKQCSLVLWLVSILASVKRGALRRPNHRSTERRWIQHRAEGTGPFKKGLNTWSGKSLRSRCSGQTQ